MRHSRLRALGLLMAVFGVVASAGCTEAISAADRKITLTVDTFGKFGYDELFKQYEQDHPNITVKSRVVENLDVYWPKLNVYLAAGSGAGDVVAMEEGVTPFYKGQSDSFVDLARYGANAMKADFLPWKWAQGTLDNGKVVALGTDIGGLAMCYRKDLFAKAGLPTDRDAVSKLWPTWEAFRQTGLRFKAAGTGAAFVDSPDQILAAALSQAAAANDNVTYFDRDDKLIIETSPAVKTAWAEATSMVASGLSSKIETWTDAWHAGFRDGTFATTACPSWMLGIIQDGGGPQTKDKWDVAAIPGGGGNWGGSFLAVPVQSKHPREAAELAMFLTSPASHVAAFKAVGALPSDVKSLQDPDFLAITNPYFGNAPVGKIFGEGATKIQPMYVAVRHRPVAETTQAALDAYVAGKITADAAWQQAVAAAKRKAV
ncbi:ABC transporter substrate-binding protein [Dactylosporangium sp. NPDC050588]|uniref:ABC transporter substrate-binding protein n=1 Tax=Dactylosporangium sp. NPDC050588 TaxID=3157211 RepID=UPI0033FD5CA3